MQSTKQIRQSVAAALTVLLLALNFGCGKTTYVDGLDTWHQRDTPLQPDDVLTAVAFGAGTFVAVGDEAATGQGIILTSPDGVNWSRAFADVAFPLLGVTYGNGLFVAAGAGILFTSPDAVNWTRRFLDSNYNFRSVSFFVTDEGRPLFMAVGWGPSEANPYYLGGVALVSSDGLAWTSGDLAAPAEMAESVAFGHGTFVVVAHPLFDAEYHFLSSGDTVHWTSGDWEPQKLLFGVRFTQNSFVAIGGDVVDTTFHPEVVRRRVLDARDRECRRRLARHRVRAGTFVAVGHGLSEGSVPVILTSTDGVRWTEEPPGSGSGLLGIAFGQDTFVAVGSNGTILQSDHVSARL